MRQDLLSVVTLIVIFVYVCLVEGTAAGNKLRRYLYATSSLHHSSDCAHSCLHGTCVTSSFLSTEHCRCDHGWTGSLCDRPVGCEHSCLHGSCSSISGRCHCHDGWTGSSCDVPVDAGTCRHSSDCREVITCDAVSKATCYFGQMCACVPIDKDRRMRFVNGLQSGGLDTNGGVQTIHLNSIEQQNFGDLQSQGTHCGPYYCAHGSCMYQSMNGFETHSCTCSPGWHGDQCDQQKAGSYSQGTHCGPYYCAHGSCTYQSMNGVVTHSCTCNPGWHGDQCDQQKVQTTTTTTTTAKPEAKIGNKECNYHGYWTQSGCSCHDYWTGAYCQYPPGSGNYDLCHNHCGEHGTCTRHFRHNGNEFWNCKCDYGWHGTYCTLQYTYVETHTHHCYNTYCVNGECTYLKDEFGHMWEHHCKCDQGWDGKHCDQNNIAITPTTTTTATTPQTTTQQTTLPPVSATSSAIPTLSEAQITTTNTLQSSTAFPLIECNHVDTLSAIAQQTSVSNQNAYECSPGLHTSHEALVLTDCPVSQSPSLWKQGANVMSGCSTNAIPNYTPIAAFDNGQYSSRGSLSGIFLGCTSDGFRMAVQTCGQTPYIAELHIGGSNTLNPNSYFTIS